MTINSNNLPDEILDNVSDFLSNRKPNVVEINYKSDDVLNYDAYRENGLRVIVIGGTRLSRGLTLEGLTVNYFVRHAGPMTPSTNGSMVWFSKGCKI